MNDEIRNMLIEEMVAQGRAHLEAQRLAEEKAQQEVQEKERRRIADLWQHYLDRAYDVLPLWMTDYVEWPRDREPRTYRHNSADGGYTCVAMTLKLPGLPPIGIYVDGEVVHYEPLVPEIGYDSDEHKWYIFWRGEQRQHAYSATVWEIRQMGTHLPAAVAQAQDNLRKLNQLQKEVNEKNQPSHEESEEARLRRLAELIPIYAEYTNGPYIIEYFNVELGEPVVEVYTTHADALDRLDFVKSLGDDWKPLAFLAANAEEGAVTGKELDDMMAGYDEDPDYPGYNYAADDFNFDVDRENRTFGP